MRPRWKPRCARELRPGRAQRGVGVALTQSPALADLFCQWPALRRLDGDEVGFEAPTVEAAVRMVNSLSAMSSMLR